MSCVVVGVLAGGAGCAGATSPFRTSGQTSTVLRFVGIAGYVGTVESQPGTGREPG
jgi:hypothetical protein